MKLNTLRFGEVEVDEQRVVVFPQGIPGFLDKKKYVMLTPDEDLPFSFMQSVEDGDLAFIVTNPFLYFPDYDFELPESVQHELKIVTETDVMVFSIVTVGANDEITVNLLAPIILNTKEKLARQVILHQSPYKTKHKIDTAEREEVGAPMEQSHSKGDS